MEPPRNAALGRWINGELQVCIDGDWKPVWLTVPMSLTAARALQRRDAVDEDDDPRIVMTGVPPRIVAPRAKARPILDGPQMSFVPQPPPPAVAVAPRLAC